MKRRILSLFGLVLVVVWAVAGLTACGGEVKGKEFTSTVSGGHTHTVLIPDSDYAKPPTEKIYTLSKGVDGHTHKIVLRAVDFSNMKRGIEVTRPTSQAPDGHSHEITVR
jgi:hypothetical protein